MIWIENYILKRRFIVKCCLFFFKKKGTKIKISIFLYKKSDFIILNLLFESYDIFPHKTALFEWIYNFCWAKSQFDSFKSGFSKNYISIF